MVKEAVYKDVLRRAEQALDLQASYTPRQLAVVLGGEPAADLAERLLRAYEVRREGDIRRSVRTKLVHNKLTTRFQMHPNSNHPAALPRLAAREPAGPRRGEHGWGAALAGAAGAGGGRLLPGHQEAQGMRI